MTSVATNPARSRPMGNRIGRQPRHILVTPSKQPSAWYGQIRGGQVSPLGVDGGERFTVQQQEQLIARGIDIPTAESITVFRNAADREVWWPAGTLPPVWSFECPVIRRLATGQVRVIAPSGAEEIVEHDGWTRPARGRFAKGGR